MRDKILFLAILGLISSSVSFAENSDGIEFTTIGVNGTTYNVPIGNKERQSDLYLLKKALKGDKDAREVFLGGSPKKDFYIGFETPLWLTVTTDSEYVTSPLNN